METTGEKRHVRELMNELVLFLPRAGLPARVEKLIDFCEENNTDGWVWKVDQLPQGDPRRTLKQLLDNVERSGTYKQTWGRKERFITRLHVCVRSQNQAKAYEMTNGIGGWHDIFEPLEDCAPTSSGFDTYQDISGKRLVIFSKIVEILQPCYGFIWRGDSLEGMSVYIADTPLEGQQKLYFRRFRTEPWRFFSRTMLFGPNLVKEYGLEKLLSAPAHTALQLPGPSVLLHGPGGFFDNMPLDVRPEEGWRDESDILSEYDAELSTYLDVSLQLA